MKTEGLLKDAHRGFVAIDTEAQSIIADLMYYCFPRMALFLNLTQPGLIVDLDEGGCNHLEICLKETNTSNITNDVLRKDIVSTLQHINQIDPEASMAYYAPENGAQGQSLILCRIRYRMDTIAAPLIKLAHYKHPDDEQVAIRTEFLSHLMERRGGTYGYKPYYALH